MATEGPAEPERTWRLIDGVTFVTGASVALVYFRDRVALLDGPTPIGWLLLAVSFFSISLTAAGPFVFFVRRFGKRSAGYPDAGDLAWLILGLPWLVVGLFRSGLGVLDPSVATRRISPILLGGLALSSAFAVATVARRWVAISPGLIETAPRRDAPRMSTTNAIGLALATAWPFQIALGWLVVD